MAAPQLLRLVNSSYFSLNRRIVTIHEAVKDVVQQWQHLLQIQQ